MVEFKIKEYDLRFIIDKAIPLTHGTHVSLSPEPPIIKEDFFWVDEIKYNPLGFMYYLYGVEGGYHNGGLYPLLPVIVSSEFLNIHDLFYSNGTIYEVSGLFIDEEDRWKVIDEFANIHYESDVYKVIATPEQIGYVYNEGPPHDHNYNWVDSRYLEIMHPKTIINCVKNDFKITIAVEEKCVTGGEECRGELILVPYMHENKVIIDSYKLLKNSSSTIIY